MMSQAVTHEAQVLVDMFLATDGDLEEI